MTKTGKPQPQRTRAPRKPAAVPDAQPTNQGSLKRATGRRKKPGASAASNIGLAPPASTSPPLLIRVPLSVRWRDLDAFNHVNNAKFLSYLEEARLRWMMAIPGEWLDEHVAPVVAATHVNYRRPIEWPNELVIELFVERLGNTSLTIGHRILRSFDRLRMSGAQSLPPTRSEDERSDGEVLYADGHVVMVWIHQKSGRAAPLPEAVRTACVRF